MMGSVKSPEIQPGDVLGDYRVEAVLAHGATWAARDARGRRVVLKLVEDDCLLRGQLHPMIKDRLGRVRELAHLGVAQLYGVERLAGQPMLVWEFVEGKPLAEALQENPPHERRVKLSRVLVAAVESLHSLGIVHGAVHERNIIITPGGALRLTHVSPLLWNETDADTVAVAGVLETMELGDSMPPGAQEMSLREMGANIRAHPMGPVLAHNAVETQATAGRARRFALLAAALVALLGAALAWGFLWYAEDWPRDGMSSQQGAP